ncbi:MAG: virulence factor SrfB, partial [Planctomycetales bacterium]
MGREGDDVGQVMLAKGDLRCSVSSPKRYLWADDESWLEGAFWHMADPYDRCGGDTFSAKVQGPMLRFMHEDDRDFLIGEKPPKEDDYGTPLPVKPQFAPRSMMVLAIYEMLCQAYTQLNSVGYRSRTTDPARSREIRSLTMTFPSGMFEEERHRFANQVRKAIEIFSQSLGKNQGVKPSLSLSIDEASAVHLTYIWSELRMLGQDPRLWFSALSRDHKPALKKSAEEQQDEEDQADMAGMVPAGRRRSRGTASRRPGAAGKQADEEIEVQPDRELRIACIDIGGGTTDLMIAKYTYQPGIDDAIRGKVLHQDGVGVAGDQLIKRLLERKIVPAFAEAIGLEDEDTQLLFGPEVPKNRAFSAQRIDWINRLFVPLTESYIQAAVDGLTDEEISHTDPDVVDPAVVESLEHVCNKLRGPGYYNLQQELGLHYEKGDFEDICHAVFDDLLFDFCCRIADHEADVVLLAGQPTKIGYIQDLVRRYVPLPSSRIVPMFNHYAGNWYPYQDAKGHAPGLIVDPKSAVVVGAALEFLTRNGMLPQFEFSMEGKEQENTYHWGVVTESSMTIREDRVLFHPVTEDVGDEWTEFQTIAQRVVIGRKFSLDESAQASPIYAIKMDVNNRIGPTRVTIRIRRVPADEEHEEYLEIESVEGEVAGEPAVMEENVIWKWRTLADERYFLDTGGLDNIEIG